MERWILCFDEIMGMGQKRDDKRKKVWYNGIIQNQASRRRLPGFSTHFFQFLFNNV